MQKFLFYFSIVILLSNCQVAGEKKFTLITSDHSGIVFNNTIVEDKELNIIDNEYLYNGGGVASADFDKDGWVDIFFTGNMVENQLYINKGDFRFENISETAGIGGKDRWKSGVALIDINNDEWIDIYVCASIDPDSNGRRNMLFVNQGLDENGQLHFEDEADKYGIDDVSYSSNAAFFDYDKDGDQDLYILVNSKQYNVQTVYREKVTDGSSNLTDKLFRNNGDGSFTDVSKEAGILIEGHGLGLSIVDVNADGWLDVYVANDFLTNDILYINHEGLFKDEIDNYFKHQSKFSMGTDAGDLNNDGIQDIITVDMLPEVNHRKKTVIQGGMYINYINDRKYGYTHQYTRNMLQLGNESGGFSEVGQLAGVHESEWSWSPLIADFDNDGDRDLFVTNGFPKDLTDKDFINFRSKVSNLATAETLKEQLPSVKVKNYIYNNKGNLQFEEVSEKWGMGQPSFSNGAAYADLDNDGDLDYIVNNINDPAFIYRNNTNPSANSDANYLRVNLQGAENNYFASGTKLGLYFGDQLLTHEHSIYRGYISTVEPTIHFGVGTHKQLDSLVIIWPDQTLSRMTIPKVNTTVQVNYNEIERIKTERTSIRQPFDGNSSIVKRNDNIGIDHKQIYYDEIDFTLQQTLPHKFSQFGPALAVGDINGDQLDDLVVGGYKRENIKLYLQQKDGTFAKDSVVKNLPYSDAGISLFDADGDGDLDMYIASGGYENASNSEWYQDRFYKNDNGRMMLDIEAIPEMTASGSVVRAADFDTDGDLDLFVGSRVIPNSYPLSPKSYLLENEGGAFVINNMNFGDLGMVNDALWSDYDGDGDVDLLVASEFKPIQFFENKEGELTKVAESGLEDFKGWWQSINAGDFDQDGDIDYVFGNFGLNNSYHVDQDRPLLVYALDIDNNQSIDPVMACYNKMEDGTYKLCPFNQWEELSALSPVFRRRFQNYTAFGRATLDSVLTKEEQASSYVLEANYLKSSIALNNGNGKFTLKELPVEAQFAPVAGMLVDYVNNDSYLDVLIIGNDLGVEVANGFMDAFNGMVLLGDGEGKFIKDANVSAHFSVPGEGEALVELALAGDQEGIYIASQNKDSLLIFQKRETNFRYIDVSPEETMVEISFKGGGKQKREFYFGSGFLSQSTRKFKFYDEMEALVFYTGEKQSRELSHSEIVQ